MAWLKCTRQTSELVDSRYVGRYTSLRGSRGYLDRLEMEAYGTEDNGAPHNKKIRLLRNLCKRRYSDRARRHWRGNPHPQL